MSTVTLRSFLKAFGKVATVLDRLRGFVDNVRTVDYHGSSSLDSQSCMTLGAFADGIANLVQSFEEWCSALEEEILSTVKPSTTSPSTVISLIKLQRDVETRVSSAFYVLWKIIHEVKLEGSTVSASATQALIEQAHRNPCFMSTAILDRLVAHMNFHSRMGSGVTASALYVVFQAAARPIWSLIFLWLKDGTSLVHQGSRNWTCREFFIAQTGVTALLDDWQEAAILRRRDDGASLVPRFLAPLGEVILSAGKSVGLLRAIGADNFFYQQGNFWMKMWPSLHELLTQDDLTGPHANSPQKSIPHKLTPAISNEHITAALSDFILPLCRLPEARLTNLLIEECGLFEHLEQLGGLFLMEWGDIMTSFSSILFERVSSVPR